ncbi:hypothetical protein ACJIZ3_010335 [Penstemon smallii]|uniref:Poor homologous synapsis 1 PH domain-containing protein n=1 Tax=Penstemon smallii TaxID=265156 RepID=A0ABD3TF10_9LAMI
MAGSLVPISTSNSEMQKPTSHNSQTSAIIDQWQVQYARFISYSEFSCSHHHPSLTPISASTKKRLRGNWISTAATDLKLIYETSPNGSDDAILIISATSRVLEEHYISKMHFSWPQVSCVAAFPARGSKAVFVSYKDGLGQIQKFALWFSTIFETEKFMHILKEILENGSVKRLPCSEFSSEISSQAEVVPSDGLAYRPDAYWQHTISADNSTQLMITSSGINADEEFISQERIQDPEASETMSALPPSFTQLLKNCHPAVDEAKPTDSGDNLKTQFMQYLEGSSFKELLATVEDVISELGEDILF